LIVPHIYYTPDDNLNIRTFSEI